MKTSVTNFESLKSSKTSLKSLISQKFQTNSQKFEKTYNYTSNSQQFAVKKPSFLELEYLNNLISIDLQKKKNLEHTEESYSEEFYDQVLDLELFYQDLKKNNYDIKKLGFARGRSKPSFTKKSVFPSQKITQSKPDFGSKKTVFLNKFSESNTQDKFGFEKNSKKEFSQDPSQKNCFSKSSQNANQKSNRFGTRKFFFPKQRREKQMNERSQRILTPMPEPSSQISAAPVKPIFTQSQRNRSQKVRKKMDMSKKLFKKKIPDRIGSLKRVKNFLSDSNFRGNEGIETEDIESKKDRED